MKKEIIEKFIKELKEDCGDYISFEQMNERRIEIQLLLILQEYDDMNF